MQKSKKLTLSFSFPSVPSFSLFTQLKAAFSCREQIRLLCAHPLVQSVSASSTGGRFQLSLVTMFLLVRTDGPGEDRQLCRSVELSHGGTYVEFNNFFI